MLITFEQRIIQIQKKKEKLANFVLKATSEQPPSEKLEVSETKRHVLFEVNCFADSKQELQFVLDIPRNSQE